MIPIRPIPQLIESGGARARFVRRIAIGCAATVALLVTPDHLHAALVAGGAIISPPMSTFPAAIPASPVQRAFNEVQNLVLPVPVEVDPGGVFVPAGTKVDSHMIFLDNGGTPAFPAVTTWTFDGIILGVMSDLNGTLELATSGLLGAPLTTYPPPPSLANRGFESTDGYTIVAPTRIEVDMNVSTSGDWIRVLTCSKTMCIDFEDLAAPMGFPCPSSFVSGGVTINVQPLSCVGVCGGASVLLGPLGAPPIDNEIDVFNAELEFRGLDTTRVKLLFFDPGPADPLTLLINGVPLAPCPAPCFLPFNGLHVVAGETFDVKVTFLDLPCDMMGDTGMIEIIAVTGCINSFAIGAAGKSELRIDDVCMCDACSCEQSSCPQDLDGDGDVDGVDLATLLARWGKCN